jgi:hypothetical protein
MVPSQANRVFHTRLRKVDGVGMVASSNDADGNLTCARLIRLRIGRSVVGVTLGILVSLVPSIAAADLVWNGDFSTGNFLQYHHYTDDKVVKFGSVPPYGRPIQYGGQISGHIGNGDLLSLVSADGRNVGGISYPAGPTRGSSPFAAKFTVKNSANGVEPDDCDPSPADTCERRRVVLKQQAMHPDWYNALPHMAERWVSFSVYIPSDFPSMDGEGPQVFGIKMRKDSYASYGYFNITIENNTWRVTHRWSPSLSAKDDPWQYGMFYAGNYDGEPYPRSDFWPEGLLDYPDLEASQTALKSLKKGGWTDWILHYKQDHRGSEAGGMGFLRLWKREDAGPWVEVLHIRPKTTSRGGMTFNHGIGYNLSDFVGSDAGAGTIIGMYGKKSFAWDKPNNTILYFANHKIGDHNSKFSEMSHDGSSPDSDPDIEDVPPKPPEVLPVE